METLASLSPASFGQGRDDFEQVYRVVQAGGISPVGDIDLFFYSSSMKTSVRESIDGKNVALVLFQPVSEFIEFLGICQCRCSLFAKSKPDGVVFVAAANTISNGQRMRL